MVGTWAVNGFPTSLVDLGSVFIRHWGGGERGGWYALIFLCRGRPSTASFVFPPISSTNEFPNPRDIPRTINTTPSSIYRLLTKLTVKTAFIFHKSCKSVRYPSRIPFQTKHCTNSAIVIKYEDTRQINISLPATS